VVGRGWGHGGEMTQALYAHMNNKTIKKKMKSPTNCQYMGKLKKFILKLIDLQKAIVSIILNGEQLDIVHLRL
jgi:hypothetical protein